jgi:LacI family transcriptional regulator
VLGRQVAAGHVVRRDGASPAPPGAGVGQDGRDAVSFGPDGAALSHRPGAGNHGRRRSRVGRPTAIFAGADIVAMGVLEALEEAGLSAPGDISVAGYDNTEFAALGPVSLTTVDQAGRQFGSNAARLLLDRIADRHRPSVFMSLSPTLVARRTTGPPASAATGTSS